MGLASPVQTVVSFHFFHGHQVFGTFDDRRGAPRRVVAHAAEQPPSGFHGPERAARIRRERQKADLPQQINRPPVPRRAKGAEEVTRVTNRTPRRGHCRAPD
eukprot:5615108-Alexandrium_andersonii.AAC.1